MKDVSFEDVSGWLGAADASTRVGRWLQSTKGEKTDKYKNHLRQQLGTQVETWAKLARGQSYHWRTAELGKTTYRYELLPEDWQGLFALDATLRTGAGLVVPSEEVQYQAHARLEEAYHWSQWGKPMMERRRAKTLIRQELAPETQAEKWLTKAVQLLGQTAEFEHLNQLPSVVAQLRALDPDAPAQDWHLPPAIRFAAAPAATWHHPLLGIWAQQFLLEATACDDRNALLVVSQHAQRQMVQAGYHFAGYVSRAVITVRTAAQWRRAHDEVARTHDLSPYFCYQWRAMRAAINSLRGYVRRKQEDRRQAARFEHAAGVNGRQAQIIKWMQDEPDTEFTLKEIQGRYDVVYQTARTDVMALEEAGLLEKYIEGKKKQVYRRAADFDQQLAHMLN